MKRMIYSIIITVLLLNTIGGKLKAQERVDLAPSQLTVSVVPLMLHYEGKISDNQSLTFGGGLAYSVYYTNINGQGNTEAYTTPFLTGSFRNYYKRKRVNKDNLKQNSGNYVGLYSYHQFKTPVDIDALGVSLGVELTSLDSYAIGPVWGFQRNYASGIHLDLSLGIGYIGFQSDEFVEIQQGINFIERFEFGFKL